MGCPLWSLFFLFILCFWLKINFSSLPYLPIYSKEKLHTGIEFACVCDSTRIIIIIINIHQRRTSLSAHTTASSDQKANRTVDCCGLSAQDLTDSSQCPLCVCVYVPNTHPLHALIRATASLLSIYASACRTDNHLKSFSFNSIGWSSPWVKCWQHIFTCQIIYTFMILEINWYPKWVCVCVCV